MVRALNLPTIEILSLPVCTLPRVVITSLVSEWLTEVKRRCIVTLNPEIALKAQKDPALLQDHSRSRSGCTRRIWYYLGSTKSTQAAFGTDPGNRIGGIPFGLCRPQQLSRVFPWFQSGSSRTGSEKSLCTLAWFENPRDAFRLFFRRRAGATGSRACRNNRPFADGRYGSGFAGKGNRFIPPKSFPCRIGNWWLPGSVGGSQTPGATLFSDSLVRMAVPGCS